MASADDTRRAEQLRRRREAVRGDEPAELEVAALGYDNAKSNAPTVLAQGRGHVAERILEVAREHDIPLRQDPTLVSILGALDVGAEVPPDLYGVIAEVLAWAYHTDKVAASGRADRRAA